MVMLMTVKDTIMIMIKKTITIKNTIIIKSMIMMIMIILLYED